MQEQLSAAGFSLGTIDGVIGGRTRSAWARFADQNDLYVRMDLTEITAPNHCHRIGIADPALQAFWPARAQPFDFAFGPEVPLGTQIRVRDSAARMVTRVADLLQAYPAATTQLLVATDARQLRQLIDARIPYRIRNLEEGLQRDCNSADRIGAAASPGMVRLCIPAVSDGREKTDLSDLDFVTAHEITHAIQLQIEGDVRRLNDRGRVRLGYSPLWLIEGLADLVGAHLTTGRSVASLRRTGLRRLQGTTIPELASLDGREALRTDRLAIYRVGLVAVASLVQEHGFPAFGDLFRAVGNGTPFETAFQERFGIALSDFEAQVDTELLPTRQFAGVSSATGSRTRPFPDPSPQQAEAIRCVQRGLARLGYSPGGADGMIGPRTLAAFSDFRNARPQRGASLTPLSAGRWCDRIAALAD